MSKPKKGDNFEATVERAIMEQLGQNTGAAKDGDKNGHPAISFDERNKAIANAIRWAAVKARLPLAEHGSGWEEDT